MSVIYDVFVDYGSVAYYAYSSRRRKLDGRVALINAPCCKYFRRRIGTARYYKRPFFQSRSLRRGKSHITGSVQRLVELRQNFLAYSGKGTQTRIPTVFRYVVKHTSRRLYTVGYEVARKKASDVILCKRNSFDKAHCFRAYSAYKP